MKLFLFIELFLDNAFEEYLEQGEAWLNNFEASFFKVTLLLINVVLLPSMSSQ